MLVYFYIQSNKPPPPFPTLPPRKLIEGPYLIQNTRNKLYLSFDHRKSVEKDNNNIIKNVVLDTSAVAWVFELQSDQTFMIHCVDQKGVMYYLFPFEDQQLGCTLAYINNPISNNDYYKQNFLSFDFQLQKDGSYVIKWIAPKEKPQTGYMAYDFNFNGIVNPDAISTWKVMPQIPGIYNVLPPLPLP